MSVMSSGQSTKDSVFEDFSGSAKSRWDFVTDGVMGGVSTGRMDFVACGTSIALRLQGSVSTENNGGFIQARRRFSEVWPSDAQGMRLGVRGNEARYFVFLKTPHLSRIWHSYRAQFIAGTDWHDVDLPFGIFAPSHIGMPAKVSVPDVNSIAIVAYGADHDADVLVRSIRLY